MNRYIIGRRQSLREILLGEFNTLTTRVQRKFGNRSKGYHCERINLDESNMLVI